MAGTAREGAAPGEDLLHALGPALLQGLDGGAPGLDLRGVEFHHFVAGGLLHPLAAGELEIGPGRGELGGPGIVAVVVDDLLLRRRSAVIGRLVHRPGVGRRVERHVEAELRDFLDAEQEDRVPREGDGVRHAALQRIPRFRSRGLDIGAAQRRHHLADRDLSGADLQSFHVAGQDDLLLGVKGAGIMDEGEAEMRVAHLLRRIFAVPGVHRERAALGVADRERKLRRVDDREAAGLVAGADIADIGDAVANHVVMVERLAELLGREDHPLDRAAGLLLHIGRPILRGLDQRMGRRNPERDPQGDRLVLSLYSRRRGEARPGENGPERQRRGPAGRESSRPRHEVSSVCVSSAGVAPSFPLHGFGPWRPFLQVGEPFSSPSSSAMRRRIAMKWALSAPTMASSLASWAWAMRFSFSSMASPSAVSRTP